MQYCTNDWNEGFGLSSSFANYLLAIRVLPSSHKWGLYCVGYPGALSFYYLTLPGTCLNCGFLLYVYITYFMAYSNCAINPCICFMFSGNYRQGLKRLQDRVN